MLKRNVVKCERGGVFRSWVTEVNGADADVCLITNNHFRVLPAAHEFMRRLANEMLGSHVAPAPHITYT